MNAQGWKHNVGAGRNAGRRPGSRFRRAAALVEFAVVLPVLMTILFGIIEFGHVFMIRQTCQHAAREGCRIATLQATDKPYSSEAGPVYQRISQVMTAAGVTFNSGMLTIVEDTTENPVISITVSVPYEDVALTHYLGSLSPNVNGSCSMRKE